MSISVSQDLSLFPEAVDGWSQVWDESATRYQSWETILSLKV